MDSAISGWILNGTKPSDHSEVSFGSSTDELAARKSPGSTFAVLSGCRAIGCLPITRWRD
jgi:hypothetical protein